MITLGCWVYFFAQEISVKCPNLDLIVWALHDSFPSTLFVQTQFNSWIQKLADFFGYFDRTGEFIFGHLPNI